MKTRHYNTGGLRFATIALMAPDDFSDVSVGAASVFTAADVLAILRERGWLVAEASVEQQTWCERAAAMLGGYAADRAALADLLALVFHYDAREIVSRVESHVVLSRYAAREVLRRVALLLLDGDALTSEGFKEIVTALKDGMELRGRELFHPIRLALAGRAGEGELDRVILLLDEAAAGSFTLAVKSARERIVEFCAALD
ncbi:MAG TPA: hypothetical protein VE822_04110 [Candidatus Elarobacter sp.]|nr:hypothetical protein [Candidatus Elarobacter sp.]